jgi:hypothetical protein
MGIFSRADENLKDQLPFEALGYKFPQNSKVVIAEGELPAATCDREGPG